MKKMTVYELVCKLENKNISTEDVVLSVGNYPVLSHMIMLGDKNGGLELIREFSRVIPEMTCEIVEKRLRKSGEMKKVKNENVSRETSISTPENETEVKKEKLVKKTRKPVQEPQRKVQVEDNGSETEYEKLSTVKCYELCRKRGIPCKTKEKKQFYIDLLENYDSQQEGSEWDQIEGDWEGVE